MNKIAVFDLDGTLLDTLDDLRDSVNHALLAGGMPPEAVRRCGASSETASQSS